MKIVSPKTLRRRRTQRRLPEPIPPATPYIVDVVVPFHAGDAHYLPECLAGLAAQKHCTPIVHVIQDGDIHHGATENTEKTGSVNSVSPWLNFGRNVRCYRHNEKPGQGPYRLTNALVAGGHCRTSYLAIQDADDISLPDRLWKQISLLQQTGADMVSSACTNFVDAAHVDDATLHKRMHCETIIKPGRVYDTVPLGRCVNTTRTMTLSLFRQLNGFADYYCTGDFDFDNRARFAGVRVLDDQTILGRRRLQPSSLTNGLAVMSSPRRQADMQRLHNNLKLMQVARNVSRAARLGALDTAFALEVLS